MAFIAFRGLPLHRRELNVKPTILYLLTNKLDKIDGKQRKTRRQKKKQFAMFANESGNVNSECSFGKSTTLRNNIETFP